jgi:hypothetical protein
MRWVPITGVVLSEVDCIFFYKVLTFLKQGINQNDLIVILLCAMCNAKIFQEVKLLVEQNFI